MELGWDLKGTMMEVEWNIESVNCRLQVCLFYERGHMITHQGRCGEHEGGGRVCEKVEED